MAAFYGHRWGSSYGIDPAGIAGDTWAAGLASLSPAQLARGLEECARRADPWPPSMGEFRAMCLGVPPLAQVLLELRPGHPSPSHFARLCWRYVDPWRLQRANEGAADAMLKSAYEQAANFVMREGAIPEPSMQLAHDPATERALYDEIHFARMQKLNVANDAKDDADNTDITTARDESQ